MSTSSTSGGWNRPSAAPKSAPKKPSALRGVLAGLIVVALAVGSYVVFFSGSDAGRPPREKGAKTIKTTKPAKAAKVAAKPEGRDPAKVRKNPDDFVLERPEVPKATNKIDMAKYNPNENRIFSTTAEQLISWVTSVEPGDMPFPMPELDKKDRENLAAILISKNEVKEGDSEALANLKRSVDYAKKEMMQYIKEGGDPDDFLQYYHRELLKAYELRCEAYKQIDAIIDDDPELGKEFMAKINEKFAEQGIKQFAKEEFE